MSKRKRKQKDDDDNKPLAMRADKLADWLEDIDESASFVRAFRLWWNRNRILELALEACSDLADLERKDGPHDKIRRALNIAVVAMGGANLDWKSAKPKEA